MSLRLLRSRAIIRFPSKHYPRFLCTTSSSPPPPPAASPTRRSFLKHVVAALTGATALTAYSWNYSVDEIDEKTRWIRESARYTTAGGDGDTAFAKLGDYLDFVIPIAGYTFVMGAVVSFPFCLLKGLFCFLNGTRLVGACHAVCLNVPRAGGKCAGYFVLSRSIHHTLDVARQKDRFTDTLNGIAGDVIAIWLITMCRGARASAGFAALGGFIIYVQFTMIEQEKRLAISRLAGSASK